MFFLVEVFLLNLFFSFLLQIIIIQGPLLLTARWFYFSCGWAFFRFQTAWILQRSMILNKHNIHFITAKEKSLRVGDEDAIVIFFSDVFWIAGNDGVRFVCLLFWDFEHGGLRAYHLKTYNEVCASLVAYCAFSPPLKTLSIPCLFLPGKTAIRICML